MNDITEVRGMSEPLFFAFNVKKNKGRLIGHAICFTSFELMDGDALLKLAAEDDDPRMTHLIHFIWENHLKHKADKLKKAIEASRQEIDELDAKLDQTKQAVKDLQP